MAIDKQLRKAQRANNLQAAIDDCVVLESLGYNTDWKTGYMFRVNNMLDVYPSNRKYFDNRTKSFGIIPPGSFKDFVVDRLK